MNQQILGLFTGIIFGFLLQKGRVLRFEKQIGAMLFKDMTIFKFMMSAIIVGMLGVHLLEHFGIIALNHKAMNLGAIAVGGVIFGIGWAISGFCPGTSVGALGEGRWHAVWSILGMVAGAVVFAVIYPFLKKTVISWADLGKISLTDATGINPWIFVVVFTLLFLSVFVLFEKKKL